MMRVPARALGIVLVALALRSAAAQELSAAASEGVVAMWRQDLGEVEHLLTDREWKQAKRKAEGLLDSIVQRLRSGSGSGPLLGSAVAMRAVARAGSGDFEAAAWDWHVARSLFPNVIEVDLARFGDAGSFFSSAGFDRFSEKLLESASDESPGGGERGAAERHRLPRSSAPRKLHAPVPGYPRAKQNACVEQPVALTFVIDGRGRPVAPRFDDSADPILAYSALETIREWRYEPAKVDGRAQAIQMFQTVNYRMLFCRDPRAAAD